MCDEENKDIVKNYIIMKNKKHKMLLIAACVWHQNK